MRYYEVLVGDTQFHGDSALTYCWSGSLPVGSVVKIALRSRTVLGIILAEVLKPDFIVKPIEAVGSNLPLSDETLRVI